MELSKTQLAFYTIFLLILAGGMTMAFAPAPEENGPLWTRIWKVEEPVTVDGTVSVDDSNPIDVEGTMTVSGEVAIAQPITIDEPVTVDGEVIVTTETGVPLEVVLDEPIEVTLAPNSKIRITGKTIHLVNEEVINPETGEHYSLIDISGYKKVYVYFQHSGDVKIRHQIVLAGPTGAYSPGGVATTYPDPKRGI